MQAGKSLSKHRMRIAHLLSKVGKNAKNTVRTGKNSWKREAETTLARIASPRRELKSYCFRSHTECHRKQ